MKVSSPDLVRSAMPHFRLAAVFVMKFSNSSLGNQTEREKESKDNDPSDSLSPEKKSAGMSVNKMSHTSSNPPGNSHQVFLLRVHRDEQACLPGHLVQQQLAGKPLSNSWVNPLHPEVSERKREEQVRQRQEGWEQRRTGERVVRDKEELQGKSREKERQKHKTEKRQGKRREREIVEKEDKGKGETRRELKIHSIHLSRPLEER